jgi:hypothetical protein
MKENSREPTMGLVLFTRKEYILKNASVTTVGLSYTIFSPVAILSQASVDQQLSTEDF